MNRSSSVSAIKEEIFPKLGLVPAKEGEPLAGVFHGNWGGRGKVIEKFSPIDQSLLAKVTLGNELDYNETVLRAQTAFAQWRKVPAPQRGELIRRLGQKLSEFKRELGLLVSLEAGKILAEGEGEVQEMIDICHFAVGLSRQLYGLTIASERPEHRMLEQWHPLGIVGIISAFNFPVAVWSWNSALAVVCGNTTIWKPSEKTPLTAIACTKIAESVAREMGVNPAIFNLVIGESAIGQALAKDPRVALVSATGSTRMGRAVAEQVAKRLGKTLLELGGNNALIVTESANLDLAVRAIVFGAVGTAGQRCTSTRRLIVHESVKDELVDRLKSAYQQLRIGSPLASDTLMGPLIDEGAVKEMQATLTELTQSGASVFGGERIEKNAEQPSDLYVKPSLIEGVKAQCDAVQRETFAPILYVLPYGELEEALEINNAVKQGLSSAIFSSNLYETEKFLSALGSDCGIANVNLGTSGAEIGGAFGGEKETGGGRESGSDAWKNYMRRQTVTINYGHALPLAQGIRFD